MNHRLLKYPKNCTHCGGQELICRTVGMGYLRAPDTDKDDWEVYDFEPKDYTFRFCCVYCGHMWDKKMEK